MNTEKVYDCRYCPYHGPMPDRTCPECTRGLSGATPGNGGRPRKAPPAREAYARLGTDQAKALGNLETMSGLDGSKVIRLALAQLHAKAVFDGSTPEDFERMLVGLLGKDGWRQAMGTA